MKYFQLDGTINNESLSNFLQFLNESDKSEKTIVLDSTGGKSNSTRVILNIINSDPDEFTLINCGSYSAAFYLFQNAVCQRKLVHGCIGMQHKSFCMDLSVNTSGAAVYEEDRCMMENMQYSIVDDVAGFMTKAELKRYEADKDVYFTFKRMKLIFPKAEII